MTDLLTNHLKLYLLFLQDSSGALTTISMTNLLTNLTSPADEFFHGGVLQISNGLHEIGSLKWQLVLALFVAWIVVFGVIVKGGVVLCCGVLWSSLASLSKVRLVVV